MLSAQLRHKMLAVCEQEIATKGTNVGISFYAFFANKNTTPTLLMEVARWWIETNELDHFEKATKIKAMIS